MNAICADIVEEALRISEITEKWSKPTLRLLGGVAVRLRTRNEIAPAFQRTYVDLDWIAPKGNAAEVQKLFEAAGYEPHARFNAMNGRERLLFFDTKNDRQVDIFVGSFRMCHEIPFGNRLALEPKTIPLAELLLTKMQIVELNEKDVRDSVALLYDHPVEEDDGDAINCTRVAELCAADWGLWRTFTANLETLGGHLERYGLGDEDRWRIQERIETLQKYIKEEPKPLSWRMRDKIGDRKRWYDLPEEVAGGP